VVESETVLVTTRAAVVSAKINSQRLKQFSEQWQRGPGGTRPAN
jgi:hypothetical protein